MKTLTHPQLVELLKTIKGATFCTLSYIGKNDAFNKGNKKNGLLIEEYKIDVANVKKHTKMGLFLGQGTDYTKLVNGRLKKEGKEQLQFEGGSLPYGSWVEGLEGLLLDNGKGSLQLRTYADIMHNSKTIVEYRHEGEVINPKDDKYSKFWSAKIKKQIEGGAITEGANQGTEHTIKPRNLSIDNIQEITMSGETYKII